MKLALSIMKNLYLSMCYSSSLIGANHFIIYIIKTLFIFNRDLTENKVPYEILFSN